MADDFHLLRETDWIKEWQTPWGPIIDSKLRWLGQPGEPSAQAFISAWDAADESTRTDLEQAFVFFPHELPEDVTAILAHIATADLARAAHMKAAHFSAESELSSAQQRFINALGRHLFSTNKPMDFIGENRWFIALRNDAGFHIETKIQGLWEMPSNDDWRELLEQTKPLAYRRIIQMLKRCPELLHPAAGESALPGLG